MLTKTEVFAYTQWKFTKTSPISFFKRGGGGAGPGSAFDNYHHFCFCCNSKQTTLKEWKVKVYSEKNVKKLSVDKNFTRCTACLKLVSSAWRSLNIFHTHVTPISKGRCAVIGALIIITQLSLSEKHWQHLILKRAHLYSPTPWIIDIDFRHNFCSPSTAMVTTYLSLIF